MPTPSNPVESPGSEPEAILVRGPATDTGPVAVLGAASADLVGRPLLAVLARTSRERLERQLSEAGYDPGETHVVEFVPQVDPADRVSDEDEPIHADIAGLSMELVSKLDELAEDGGVVYFDSLEPFVSVAGFESTFRFLVIVAARARAAGVPLVARLDPDAVDAVTEGTLTEAFDRVVEEPPDGAGMTG